MISSTAIDLPEHRQQVFEACICEGVFPIGMESLPARDADAIRVSLDMVDKADIYIGIFGLRYGLIPEGHDISITEMEFNRAVARGIPVLVFVMHKNHSLVIGMVEMNDDAQGKLRELKERACKERNRREFGSPAELRAEVIHALSDFKQRELQLDSPMDAIRAEKQRLEQLDPRFSVQIEATDKLKKIQVNPRQPMIESPPIQFLKDPGVDALRAFFEKGQSFQVKASDIQADASPILDNILRELGDALITIKGGARFKGCLHLLLNSEASPQLIQIDGEWVLAPKLISFSGQLSESPLKVELACELNEEGKWGVCEASFMFNWSLWERQPLLFLAYFNRISEFVHCKEFTLRGYIRGNEFLKGEKFSPESQAKKPVTDAIDWFQKCRRLARQVGANPQFPHADAIKEIESDDVRLMVELLESGYHKQENVGQIAVIVGAIPPNEKAAIGLEAAKINLRESFRTFDFCGMQVAFGPLEHTWT